MTTAANAITAAATVTAIATCIVGMRGDPIRYGRLYAMGVLAFSVALLLIWLAP